MKRFLAIFKKEFRQIRRDPLSLGMLLVVPAMLLALYGYALSFDVKHIRVAVLDKDNTVESRQLLDSMFQNPYFDKAAILQRTMEADAILARGKARAVLIIPKGYAAALARGENVAVQALVNAADATTGTTAIGYIEALADRMTRQIRAERLGMSATSMNLPVVIPEPRIWFNSELQSAHFLVPGLIGMLMMLSGVIATSLSIVREKENETMEQMMVSPVKPEELILGKTLPYVLVGLLTMGMILILGRILFGVEVKGSYGLLALTTILFLFAALGMGILISAVTRSQQMAFQIAALASMLPSVLLSGLIFPINNMPLPIQAISYFVAPRYFIAALRGIILKDVSAVVLLPQWAGLLALGILFNLLAASRTRKAT